MTRIKDKQRHRRNTGVLPHFGYAQGQNDDLYTNTNEETVFDGKGLALLEFRG
jgi:hypothetical protein